MTTDSVDSLVGATRVSDGSTRRTLEVRGIPVEVTRKGIKHLHLGVYPPDGQVRVSAPLRLDDDAVRLAVVSRWAWIRKKRAEFAGQRRQSRREFVSGESHYVEGRRYRLDVVEWSGPTLIHLRGGGWIEMCVRPGVDRDGRETFLYRWYRGRLRHLVSEIIPPWEGRLGVEVKEWRIRRMKTKWGSCNSAAGRIWLNSELAKKSVRCVEYVAVHEMVHLTQRGHGTGFEDTMDEVMPDWRRRADELNRTPLADEYWGANRAGG